MEAHFVDLDHEACILQEGIPILTDDTNLLAKDTLLVSDSIKWKKSMEEEMKALKFKMVHGPCLILQKIVM